MLALIQSFSSAFRSIRRRPQTALVAILTAGIGIGSSTAIFSLINGMLLHPLPYPDADQLIRIHREIPGGDSSIPVTSADYENWKNGAETLAGLGALSSRDFEVALNDPTEVETMPAAEVDPSLFEVLGVKPLLGRLFTEAEARGQEKLVLLSYGFWNDRTGRREDILGSKVYVGGEPRTVIGVLPAGLEYPLTETFYMPRFFSTVIPNLPPPSPAGGGGGPQRRMHLSVALVGAIARVKPGIPLADVEAELDRLADKRINLIGGGQTPRIVVQKVTDFIVGRIRPALWLLSAAVIFVLLIACANVANLLLSRGMERQRETAIRAALGADRWKLIALMINESVVLSLLGGGLGILLAWVGLKLLVAESPVDLPRSQHIGIDWVVLAFTTGVAVLTGVLFGLAPALQISKPDLNKALKEGVTDATGGLRMARRNRLRLVLVTIEVAFSMVLLVGAGLLGTSFLKLLFLDPGFNPRNLVSVSARPDFGPGHDLTRLENSYDELLRELNAAPGIELASLVSSVPPNKGLTRSPFEVDGAAYGDGGELPTAHLLQASDGYFETMQIRLLQGRTFEHTDINGRRIVVINESVADYLGEKPLGKTLFVNEQDYEVVGIVQDVFQAGPQEDPEPIIYQPARSGVTRSGNMVMVRLMTVLLRSSLDAETLAPVIQDRVETAGMKLGSVATIEQSLWQSIAQPRFYSILFGVFAVVALILAAVGLFGVISYAVTQATREIGIRMALGAQPGQVLTSVLKQGLALTVLGLVLGWLGALSLGRFLESFLYRVDTADIRTFAIVSLVFVLAAVIAAYLPARRATRIDPWRALRYE